jgi:hypothetical protein
VLTSLAFLYTVSGVSLDRMRNASRLALSRLRLEVLVILAFRQCVRTYRATAGATASSGPDSSNFDVSLFKNNRIVRISEQSNIQFRMEAFKVFNHLNCSPPAANNQVFNGDGCTGSLTPGPPDTTATTSRPLQSAIKVIW